MNELAVVSTDHCPFCFKDQKELGVGDFSKIPNGIGGVEHRMELIYQGVVAGRAHRWSGGSRRAARRRRACSACIRRKGIVAPGADADVVVWDPNGRRRSASTPSTT